MSCWRAKFDRTSLQTRDRIKSEPDIVAEQLEVALIRLRELLRRIEHERLEAGDYPVLEAYVWEAIAEARDREIVTIAGDGTNRSVIDADESTHDGEGRPPTDASAPSRAEPQSLAGGARRRG